MIARGLLSFLAFPMSENIGLDYIDVLFVWKLRSFSHLLSLLYFEHQIQNRFKVLIRSIYYAAIN